MWVATCSFTGRDAECQSIQLPGCPTGTRRVVSLLLANLVAVGPCVAAGEMTLDARPTENGGVHVLWDAQEFDPITCRATGAEQKGEMSLSGPCCDRSLDVYLPLHNLTARVQVRSDWQR